mmetsp:Transcript_9993/g.32759  ORF Transcript_9993/g.32759 Transcript_9993/m.32759 type:complete len:215 (+) Transcript_9993:2554-3198(+)
MSKAPPSGASSKMAELPPRRTVMLASPPPRLRLLPTAREQEAEATRKWSKRPTYPRVSSKVLDRSSRSTWWRRACHRGAHRARRESNRGSPLPLRRLLLPLLRLLPRRRASKRRRMLRAAATTTRWTRATSPSSSSRRPGSFPCRTAKSCAGAQRAPQDIPRLERRLPLSQASLSRTAVSGTAKSGRLAQRCPTGSIWSFPPSSSSSRLRSWRR